LVLAHPQGFHTRVTLELYSTSIVGLIAMDIDGGDRTELLRAGVDANKDGVLDAAETGALKKKLTSMATRALKLWISGYPIAIEVKDAKVSLKSDPRVGPGGVSVAVLLELKHPYAVTPGMSLWLEDTAPDFGHVEVEVIQHPAPDAGVREPPVSKSLPSGERLTVRLGALASGAGTGSAHAIHAVRSLDGGDRGGAEDAVPRRRPADAQALCGG
jgi:hypothetical protein